MSTEQLATSPTWWGLLPTIACVHRNATTRELLLLSLVSGCAGTLAWGQSRALLLSLLSENNFFLFFFFPGRSQFSEAEKLALGASVRHVATTLRGSHL